MVTTPAWLRLVMPSVANVIFLALLGVLVLTPLSVRLLGDAGIGWHIRTGQQILAVHGVPRVDSFSFTMAGKPWFAWEWLYDVVVGLLEGKLGLNGVVWFTSVVIALVFAGMFRLLILRGTNLLVALMLTLLATSASMIHFLARPHVVSWLFTLVWFWILDSSERDCLRGQSRSRWLWALPFLMVVWVSVHGGFLVAFVLLAIYLLGAGWTWFRTNENRLEELLQKVSAAKRARNLAWVGLLSVAASLVNPYGWNLYAHIYSYLSNRFLMDHIEEFQSPNFHGLAQKCFLILILIAVSVVAIRGRDLRMSNGLTVLFAIYSGLYASRNIPVSSILLVMVVGPMLPSRFAGGFSQRMTAMETRLRGHLWPIVAIVATLLIVGNGGGAGSRQWMAAHFSPQRMPVEAVNYLEKNHLEGPVLSPDYWGGYLVYRLYPRTLVVVDDRHDLYGEQFFRSYLNMMQVQRGWENVLDTYKPPCVVLPRDAPLATVLSGTQGWKTSYADEVAVIFVREH
jgi:hypothetical protein